MVTVAVLLPADTLTLAGGRASWLLLASVITAPPSGAGPSSVTLPVTGSPPVWDKGTMTSDSSRDDDGAGDGAGAGVGVGAGVGSTAGAGAVISVGVGVVMDGTTDGASAVGVDVSPHAAANTKPSTSTLPRRIRVSFRIIHVHPYAALLISSL